MLYFDILNKVEVCINNTPDCADADADCKKAKTTY